MNDPILEMRGVSKSFFGIKALRAVDLTVHAGEIHALMGENGAGKSTLMKILSGAYQADPGGEILIDGQARAHRQARSAAERHGIAIIYQELTPRPQPDAWPRTSISAASSRSRGLIDRGGMRDGCRPVLERLGAAFTPATLVGAAVHRRAAARRDRARAARQIKDPGDGRADHGAVLPRDRAAVRADPPAARRRPRHHLHQPPHGRGLRAVRPRLGAARRHAMSARSTGRSIRADAWSR